MRLMIDSSALRSPANSSSSDGLEIICKQTCPQVCNCEMMVATYSSGLDWLKDRLPLVDGKDGMIQWRFRDIRSRSIIYTLQRADSDGMP
jgi:hypothetical protein